MAKTYRFSFGPMQIPVLQTYFAMEDREDGTIWYLSHLSSEDRVRITDVAPTKAMLGDVVEYGPYDGPWVGFGLRLFVRDGRIGYDMPDLGQGVTDMSSSAVTTRNGWQRYALEIYQPQEWHEEGDTLGYRLIAGTSLEDDIE